MYVMIRIICGVEDKNIHNVLSIYLIRFLHIILPSLKRGPAPLLLAGEAELWKALSSRSES